MTGESLITDEMRALIGVESASYTFEVEKGDIVRYAHAIRDDNPRFTNEAAARRTRYGGLIAPPTYLIVMRILEIQASPPLRPLPHSLDGGSEWRYFEPIRPGDRLTATKRIADIYERDGKLGRMIFIVTEIVYRNQFDEIAVLQRDTAIYFGSEEA